MRYEEMQLNVLKSMKPYWARVLALDIETNVTEEKFLTNERILSISFSRRISGKLMEANGIETCTLFLEKDNDESEKDLLTEFDDELVDIKPLCVLGYGHQQYDIPLFCIKKQHYKLFLWKIIDLCESAVHIDLYHILKYKKYKRFGEVLDSSEFADLPLMRTKELVTADRANKGKEIFRLWREDRKTLRKYAEGDAHDTLLVSERLIE